MDKRVIIIADKDADYRGRMADLFRSVGYRVETATSVVDVVFNTMEQQAPILLLGSDFDDKKSSAELIHLFKQCNRNLRVIMVSDGMPLGITREVRQEGLFFQALKPVTAADREELMLAVACACGTRRAGQQVPAALTPQEQTAICHALAETVPQTSQRSTGSLLFLAMTGPGKENGMTSLIFLGFCALIVATQLLPIFRIKLPAAAGAKHPAEAKSASPHGK
jgi:FixJ family two-component response regulator